MSDERPTIGELDALGPAQADPGVDYASEFGVRPPEAAPDPEPPDLASLFGPAPGPDPAGDLRAGTPSGLEALLEAIGAEGDFLLEVPIRVTVLAARGLAEELAALRRSARRSERERRTLAGVLGHLFPDEE